MMGHRKGSHRVALFYFLKTHFTMKGCIPSCSPGLEAISVILKWSLRAVCGPAFVLAAGLVLAQPAPEPGSGRIPKQAASAQHFMLAAAHPLAVEAGYGVLQRGGTAIDAAVAVQLVLNLVEPQSSGIGGGAFILHYWQSRPSSPPTTGARPRR